MNYLRRTACSFVVAAVVVACGKLDSETLGTDDGGSPWIDAAMTTDAWSPPSKDAAIGRVEGGSFEASAEASVDAGDGAPDDAAADGPEDAAFDVVHTADAGDACAPRTKFLCGGTLCTPPLEYCQEYHSKGGGDGFSCVATPVECNCAVSCACTSNAKDVCTGSFSCSELANGVVVTMCDEP